MKTLLALACTLLLTTNAAAQTLTTAQKATLKTAILADATAVVLYQNGDLSGLAAYYNAQASPTFTVWRTYVWPGDVGKTFNATELAGLTQLNTTRLQNLHDWLEDGINPSTAGVRQFFDDIFSGAGGTNTRAGLQILWKRLATRIERLLATGTGADAVPGTLVYEGALVYTDLVGL